jgi:hypothetical protein
VGGGRRKGEERVGRVVVDVFLASINSPWSSGLPHAQGDFTIIGDVAVVSESSSMGHRSLSLSHRYLSTLSCATWLSGALMVLQLHALLQLTASATFLVTPVKHTKMHRLQHAASRQSYCIRTPPMCAVACTRNSVFRLEHGDEPIMAFLRVTNIQYSPHTTASQGGITGRATTS